MLIRIVAAGFLASYFMGSVLLAQSPRVTDQHEYNLIQVFQKETDPAKKIEILKQWEAEYPGSQFKGARLLSMAQADGEIITRGLLFTTSTAEVDAAKHAAMDLLSNIDRYLAPENKPPRSTDDQFRQARQQLEERARAVLKL